MSRTIHHRERWTVGQWQFFEIDAAQISDSYAGRTLFGFADNTVDAEAAKVQEWYNTLEHAMAAAIAEKYTGRRGAGGTGVGTAADWFIRMIGADALVAVEYQEGQKALQDALADTRSVDGPIYTRARAMETELEKRGLVLAKMNTP